MTTEFKLYDGTTTFDLTGTDFAVGKNYVQQIADIPGSGIDPEYIQEVMPGYLQPTTVNNLATATQKLDALRKRATEYMIDDRKGIGTWLYQQVEGETGSRRALVKNANLKLEQSIINTSRLAVTQGNFPAAVIVERHPYWESQEARYMVHGRVCALRFDSGSVAFTAGEILSGDTSNADGRVHHWVVESGTWAGGDAAGIVYFSDMDSTDFQNNEALNGSTGGNNIATADGTRVGAPSLVYDYTAADLDNSPEAHDIVGDVGARIDRMTISPLGTLEQIWMGIKSAGKYGQNLYNFVPIWELELGTLGTDAALAADATASPGGAGNTKITVTPGTTAWAKRQTIKISDVTSNITDQLGLYLWLLRAKVSAGTWELQLRHGYSGMADADHVQGPIFEVTSTGWYHMNAGVYAIPAHNVQSIGLPFGTPDESELQIQVWARRTDGSGTLDMDCLCPIPIDEGYLLFSEFSISEATDYLYWGEAPNGRAMGMSYDNTDSSFDDSPTIESHNFRLPPGDGRIIIAYQGATSNISEYLRFNIAHVGRYYERWTFLRGAE